MEMKLLVEVQVLSISVSSFNVKVEIPPFNVVVPLTCTVLFHPNGS
jgi:hypothetical protein